MYTHTHIYIVGETKFNKKEIDLFFERRKTKKKNKSKSNRDCYEINLDFFVLFLFFFVRVLSSSYFVVVIVVVLLKP